MAYLTPRELEHLLRLAPEMIVKSRELRATCCDEVLNFQQKKTFEKQI
jgi:hypothetical protein